MFSTGALPSTITPHGGLVSIVMPNYGVGRSNCLSAHLFQGTCEVLLNLFNVGRPGEDDLCDNRNMYGAAAGDLSQGLGIQFPINEAGLLFD